MMEAQRARAEYNLGLIREAFRPLTSRLYAKLLQWSRHYSERKLRKSQRSTLRRLRFERNRAR
jgi:hypothetical protein